MIRIRVDGDALIVERMDRDGDIQIINVDHHHCELRIRDNGSGTAYLPIANSVEINATIYLRSDVNKVNLKGS